MNAIACITLLILAVMVGMEKERRMLYADQIQNVALQHQQMMDWRPEFNAVLISQGIVLVLLLPL